MINSLSNHIANATTAERSPLVDQLAKRADTNRDGAVSTVEFDAFLVDLIQSLDGDHRPTVETRPSSPAATPTSSAVEPQTPAPAADRSVDLRRAVAAASRER